MSYERLGLVDDEILYAAHIDHIEDGIVSIENGLNKADINITNLENTIAETNQSVSDLTIDITDINSAMSKCENDIGDMQMDISDIEKNIARLEDILNYKEPEILSFSVSPTIAEKGSTQNVNLTVTFNKELDIYINNTLVKKGISYDNTYTVSANTTYTAKGIDDKTNSIEKKGSIAFVSPIYYGAKVLEDINNAFVLSLNKKIVNNRLQDLSFTVGANDNAIIALPHAYGTPTFYVGGFEGGFNKATSFELTNTYSYKELYDVYVSTNKNLGSMTVTIK